MANAIGALIGRRADTVIGPYTSQLSLPLNGPLGPS
jgi:hypothetical protein